MRRMVCANCGYKMRVHTKSRSRKDGSQYPYSSFLCGNYARSGKQACTAHIIREETLDALMLLRLVDRIEVGDDLTVDGQNVRKVQIIYNYVGDIGGACLSLLPGTPEGTVDVRGEAV